MTFVPAADDAEDGIQQPSIEEIEAALRAAPAEIDWDWASRRLIPLFERGYTEGITGDPMVNTVSRLGIGIGFGIDFGPCFGRVTRSMARRWESSIEQIEAAAFAHLAELVPDVTSADLQSVVHQGHLFRALSVPGGWASSIVLADEAEIVRIFRTRDAAFTCPSRNSLVAFAPGTPARVVGQITAELEAVDPHPLLIDPFVMEDGVMQWGGLADEEAI